MALQCLCPLQYYRKIITAVVMKLQSRWFQDYPVTFLLRDAYALHSGDYAMARCLSVCLSVTRRYSLDTAEHTLKIFLPSGSPTTPVFPYQMGWQYSDGDRT